MKPKWHTPVLIATAALVAATAAAVVVLVVVPKIKSAGVDPAAALHKKAEELFGQKRYSDAALYYDKILTDYPDAPAVLDAEARKKECGAKAMFEEARLLARSGRYYEAGDLLSKAVGLEPDDVEINYGVGWVYMQLALDNLTSAQLAGSRGGDYFLLAKVYSELARTRFERCVALDGKHWAGYRGLALYYLFNQNYDEALAELAKAEKYSPRPEDKIAVGRLRVQAYLGKRAFGDAKETLDVMLKDYPDRGEVYYSLAEYNLRQEKPDLAEAKKALEVGVGKTFDDPGTRNQLFSLLARMKRENKDYEGALTAAAEGLAVDPFNESLIQQYTLAFGTKALATPAP